MPNKWRSAEDTVDALLLELVALLLTATTNHKFFHALIEISRNCVFNGIFHFLSTSLYFRFFCFFIFEFSLVFAYHLHKLLAITNTRPQKYLLYKYMYVLTGVFMLCTFLSSSYIRSRDFIVWLVRALVNNKCKLAVAREQQVRNSWQ